MKDGEKDDSLGSTKWYLSLGNGINNIDYVLLNMVRGQRGMSMSPVHIRTSISMEQHN